MNEYLVQKLREGRLNKNYKQSDVTKLTGIKNTTLSNYENGITEPDIDTFLQLCELYELDYAEILGEAYGLGISGTDFDIRPSEIEHIKKYRKLDPHGKEMVDYILNKEYGRLVVEYVNHEHQKESTTARLNAYATNLMAAHNDHADEPGELEKMQEDLANLSRP